MQERICLTYSLRLHTHLTISKLNPRGRSTGRHFWLFFVDLAKPSDDGVLNSLWRLSQSINSTPAIGTGYVQPGFQILPAHILIQTNAVYPGAVFDRYAGQIVAASA